MTTTWQEIGDRIYRRRYESLDLNIGLILGDGEALVIDTRATYGQADELKLHVADLTADPITRVVNTHHHWDHTFGNARFGPADLIGHRRCAEQLIAAGPAMKEQLLDLVAQADQDKVAAIDIVPPSTLFDEQLAVEVGGRPVTLDFLGRAHTDNDIVIRVDDVVFAGDILEESAPPYFGDSYPIEWPDTVSAALTSGSLFVPGHGDTMSPTAARDQLEDLRAVKDRVSHWVETGEPAQAGPYPLPVMKTALERARLTR